MVFWGRKTDRKRKTRQIAILGLSFRKKKYMFNTLSLDSFPLFFKKKKSRSRIFLHINLSGVFVLTVPFTGYCTISDCNRQNSVTMF